MPRKTMTGFALLILATLSGSSWAQTTYNDGGVHTVNGPSGPIEVEGNGTTLNVDSLASVGGSNGVQGGVAILGGSASTINVLGGQVIGVAPNYNQPYYSNDGINTSGSFTASGGLVRGGDGSQIADPGDGVKLTGSATGVISGGTFIGGNASGFGNYGFWGLSGRTSGTLSISGGTFEGGVGKAGADGGTAIVTTGNFSISGGTFQGGAGSAFGGQAGNFMLHPSVGGLNGSISGGAFSAGLNSSYSLVITETLGSTMNISGGMYTGGILTGIGGHSTLNFFGSNLNWSGPTNVGFSEGLEGSLTGTLADGNLINLNVMATGDGISVSISDGPQGEELTFKSLGLPGGLAVPEPSSIVTFTIGLLGLVAAQAYRRRRLRRRAAA